jgi:hypothetical protein
MYGPVLQGSGPPPPTFEQEAERLLRKWQAILRLQDWDITLKIGRFHEIHNEALAHCRHCTLKNSAEIMVRAPQDLLPAESWPGDNDVELTIIHELIHVKLSPLSIPDKLDVEQEQLVESLARTLVRLGGEKEKSCLPVPSPE